MELWIVSYWFFLHKCFTHRFSKFWNILRRSLLLQSQGMQSFCGNNLFRFDLFLNNLINIFPTKVRLGLIHKCFLITIFPKHSILKLLFVFINSSDLKKNFCILIKASFKTWFKRYRFILICNSRNVNYQISKQFSG